MTEFKELHEILYQATLALSDFQAGSIPLRDVLNGNRPKEFKDFSIFLKALEVYGTGYNDDIDKVKYNTRQQITHEQQAIEELQGIIEYFQTQLQPKLHKLGLSQFKGEALLKKNFETIFEIIAEGLMDMQSLLKQKKQVGDADIRS
jgi:hypothetical protein